MSAALTAAALTRGDAAFAAGNYTGALKIFTEAIAHDPENGWLYIKAAHTHERLRQPAPCLALLDQALARPMAPYRRSFALRIRASALRIQKKYRAAEAASREAVQTAPEEGWNHFSLAISLWNRRSYKPADAAFRTALQLSPGNPAMLVSYAHFLRSRGDYKAAETHLAQAIALAPDDETVMLARGQLAFRRDDLETAQDMALWALRRNAMNRDALSLLAQIKSRRSWLTGPFWWANSRIRRMNGPLRYTLFFGGCFVLGLIGASLPAAIVAFLPSAPLIYWSVIIYAMLCTGHVGYLVQRDVRRVKLRKDF